MGEAKIFFSQFARIPLLITGNLLKNFFIPLILTERISLSLGRHKRVISSATQIFA